jgi:hypothetical protein
MMDKLVAICKDTSEYTEHGKTHDDEWYVRLGSTSSASIYVSRNPQ